jgi:hypothetical protein
MRPAVVCDDVSRLVIDSVEAPPTSGSEAVLDFRHVRQAFIRGCQPAAGTGVFLKVEGPDSKAICLMGNDFTGVKRPAERAPEVPSERVVEIGNWK